MINGQYLHSKRSPLVPRQRGGTAPSRRTGAVRPRSGVTAPSVTSAPGGLGANAWRALVPSVVSSRVVRVAAPLLAVAGYFGLTEGTAAAQSSSAAANAAVHGGAAFSGLFEWMASLSTNEQTLLLAVPAGLALGFYFRRAEIREERQVRQQRAMWTRLDQMAVRFDDPLPSQETVWQSWDRGMGLYSMQRYRDAADAFCRAADACMHVQGACEGLDDVRNHALALAAVALVHANRVRAAGRIAEMWVWSYRGIEPEEARELSALDRRHAGRPGLVWLRLYEAAAAALCEQAVHALGRFRRRVEPAEVAESSPSALIVAPPPPVGHRRALAADARLIFRVLSKEYAARGFAAGAVRTQQVVAAMPLLLRGAKEGLRLVRPLMAVVRDGHRPQLPRHCFEPGN